MCLPSADIFSREVERSIIDISALQLKSFHVKVQFNVVYYSIKIEFRLVCFCKKNPAAECGANHYDARGGFDTSRLLFGSLPSKHCSNITCRRMAGS